MNAEPESQSEPKSAKILVVEHQFLVASQLIQILEAAGYMVLGPVSNVANALHMINALDGQIDAAILNVVLAGERSDPIAEELSRRRVPFMFATVYNREEIAPRFADRPRVSKPYDRHTLLRILSSIVKWC